MRDMLHHRVSQPLPERKRTGALIVVLAGSAATTLLCASGCSRVDGYRLNPTPREMTASRTGDEVANITTHTFDTNWRLFNEDLGRMFFLDKPSTLTPKPKPRP